jgi:hypothetical protein
MTSNRKHWAQQNRWGTTNSKPPGPIIMTSQSKTLSSSQIIFIALFLFAGAHGTVRLVRATARNYAEPKPISWAKPAYFQFSSSKFNVQVTYWAPLEMLLARWATENWCPPCRMDGWHVIRKHFLRVLLSP